MLSKLFRQAAMLAALVYSGHAVADESVLRTTVGGVTLTANGAVSAQGGAFDDLATGQSDQTGEWDASLVLNGEFVADNGLVWGIRAEFDTGERQVEDLQRDEIYAYVAGGFGRLEIGEQDGAADTIAIHAPIVGLGQVRGDFVRYTGSAALLTPFDTRDSLKVVYLSPPINGLRFGVSYAPEVESNTSDPNPRRRTIQENGVEVGVAFQRPIADDWAIGISGAYAAAQSDPITTRQDIESWSVGGELARDKLSIGLAYVSRGDSNSLVRGLDEDEWNAGVAWRDDQWGVAGSFAVTESTVLKNTLIGAGGYYEINRWWVVRADVVSVNEDRPAGGRDADSLVALAEISFRF
jgi:predicted porin